MKVLHHASQVARDFPGAVLAIGKFDALHRGHLKVLRAALKRARALRAPLVVTTFDPTPSQFTRLYPYRPVLSLGERIDALRRLGADAVLLLAFDEKLACMSPDAFARDVLALRLKPVSVFVGADFCFGKDRSGTVETLERLGAELGFSVRSIALVRERGEKITAPAIRGLLERGQRRRAESLLGRKL